MARYTGPKAKLSRREGTDLFLKSARRSLDSKCKLDSKPGQHGRTSGSRPSDYGIQLREKQKVRRAYGVLESQFRKYYDMAANMRGVTGENMLALLERRLDNVAYRLNFGESRPMARQMVTHGHIRVNGKKVDIASYLVKVGDVISIRDKSTDVECFKTLKEQGASRTIPKWLEFDAETLTGKVVALPQRDDIDLTIEEHLIVEFYSR